MTDVVWSEWVPFAEALATAPRVPGVYMAREGETGEIVYIGMAGERAGGPDRKKPKKPQGIRGRLSIYASGKGLASGLGEAVFDRALADPVWVRARLDELETSGPRRAKEWGRAAFGRADLHVRWTTTADKKSAKALEDRLVLAAGGGLWNKASVRFAGGGSQKAQTPRTVSVRRKASVGGAVTQVASANDLAAGQIRIPIAHKNLFPNERLRLTIVLRGETVECAWNPQNGPDKPRSGRLRPPGEVLRRLVVAGEQLDITTIEGHVTLQ